MLENISAVSATDGVDVDMGTGVVVIAFVVVFDEDVGTGVVVIAFVVVFDEDVVDEIFEVLSEVRFVLPGWLGVGVVSLDTLDPLLAVAFAGSGWLGVGVDAVVVVAFGVSPVFDACDDCVKIRQMQRQKNR